MGLRALVHLPEEGARADRHARGRRVTSRRVHPAEVDEDRAVAHAELGVAAAAQRHGHAVAVVFGGTPEAALDPGGDEADREDHVAFGRGLERARGSPALVKARVIRARRGREAGVVSGRVRQVHAALGAEIPEVRRDEVLERSHGDRGREVAGAVKGRWWANEVRVVRMCVVILQAARGELSSNLPDLAVVYARAAPSSSGDESPPSNLTLAADMHDGIQEVFARGVVVAREPMTVIISDSS